MLLKRGSQGASVRTLQERLGNRGYTTVVDGDFGSATEQAVRQFQAAQGLATDGVVGDRTWDALAIEKRATDPDDVLIEQRAWTLDQIPPGLSRERNAVLAAAIGTQGLVEVPSGSNGGPQIGHIVGDRPGQTPQSGYYAEWGINLTGMPPWCAIFVSWAIREGLDLTGWHETPFGAWFGGVAQIENWANAQGRMKTDKSLVWPAGGVFTMSRAGSGSDASSSIKAGHTGFIVADTDDGRILTIEGNTSDKVSTRFRRKADLRGYVVWW